MKTIIIKIDCNRDKHQSGHSETRLTSAHWCEVASKSAEQYALPVTQNIHLHEIGNKLDHKVIQIRTRYVITMFIKHWTQGLEALHNLSANDGSSSL